MLSPLSRGEAKIPDARRFAILPKIQTVRCSDSKDGFGLRRDESESRSASARTQSAYAPTSAVARSSRSVNANLTAQSRR